MVASNVELVDRNLCGQPVAAETEQMFVSSYIAVGCRIDATHLAARDPW